MGELPNLEYFLVVVFSKTVPGCSDLGIDFFFCSVFEVCGLSKVFEFCRFVNLFLDQLVYVHGLHGLSRILSFPCVCLGQLSDLLSSDCSSVVPVVLFCFFVCFFFFFFFLKRAISSANLKFLRFSSPTLIPSEMSAFLKTSSITAVNSIGESGSPCLTPLFIGNSSDTYLSKSILAVAWL